MHAAKHVLFCRNGGFARDHSVVIMHDPNLVHFFLGVVVGEIPSLIIEFRLDLLQPYFGRLVHGALIDHGQKDLGRLILQRAGMRQHDINLPAALGEDALHLGFDFFGRLFIWEPAPTTGQTIVFIHAVGAADDNAGIAIEVIDLAVNGEQDIRISRLHPYLATVIFSDLITELFGRAHLVIAV